MKKFKVTFTNNGARCTLSHTTTIMFADTKTEASFFCRLMYSTGDNFIISDIKQEARP